MTFFATVTWLTLLLITQQVVTRPADSADKEAIAETDNNIYSVYANDVLKDLATSEIGQLGIETEESQPVSHSYPGTDQGLPKVTTTGQKTPSATLNSSVTSPSSQLEPPGSYETRGFLANLFGSSGAAGSQKADKVGEESQKPNKIEAKVGQQSATIISATTYPEGSKPVTSSKPVTGEDKPTGTTTDQEKPTVTLTPSVKPTTPQSKPPGSSLNGEFLSSLPGLPEATGSQKPNKPPITPGSGASQLGSHSFGSSSFGSFPVSSATFPVSMAGFMPYMPPPSPPMMIGSPFGGLGSTFGGFGSPFESDASLMTQTGPTMFKQGDKNGNVFALPQWLVSLMRSIETSPHELSIS